MSKTTNGGLDQYGTESFKQQQFGTAGVERVKQWSIAFFVNVSYLTKALGHQIFLATTTTRYSSKLFIALWLQAHDAMTPQ